MYVAANTKKNLRWPSGQHASLFKYQSPNDLCQGKIQLILASLKFTRKTSPERHPRKTSQKDTPEKHPGNLSGRKPSSENHHIDALMAGKVPILSGEMNAFNFCPYYQKS
jgi:hypothetical protein